MLGHWVVNSVHGTASLPWGGVSALSSQMQTGLAPPDISIFVPAAVAHFPSSSFPSYSLQKVKSPVELYSKRHSLTRGQLGKEIQPISEMTWTHVVLTFHWGSPVCHDTLFGKSSLNQLFNHLWCLQLFTWTSLNKEITHQNSLKSSRITLRLREHTTRIWPCYAEGLLYQKAKDFLFVFAFVLDSGRSHCLYYGFWNLFYKIPTTKGLLQ